MLGHGTPYGLVSVGQFPNAEFCIIDGSMVDVLMKQKSQHQCKHKEK
jgi:hypothetical protein